jgi:hypothetical protein
LNATASVRGDSPTPDPDLPEPAKAREDRDSQARPCYFPDFPASALQLCYDMRWDRLWQRILVHKFNLFPDRRRWQIEK